MTNLKTLVDLFFSDAGRLGVFEEAAVDAVPSDYRNLLAHEKHMTVTVEAFHHSPVDLIVLDTRLGGPHYSRKILLAHRGDHRIVQFGIMRIDLDQLSAGARAEVEGQSKPLGRILIEHDVHRQVRLGKLWRVTPGADLRGWFSSAPGEITYGRTARIDCDGKPAIELLEIVSPV